METFLLFSHCFLLFLPGSSLASNSILYFDNFNDGSLVYGTEGLISDYMVLANDPAGDLPPAFTICSSLYAWYLTTHQTFLQMYQEDGSHWLQVQLLHRRNYETFIEKIKMYFNGELLIFLKSGLPAIPHSWYHMCLGLDTASGHLRVVINGYTIIDEVVPSFVQSQNKKPKSLKGKIGLFKTNDKGYWYLSRTIYTNLNVHKTQLDKNAMMALTTSTNCTVEGDYLSWTNMQWNTTGTVQNGNVSTEELCQRQASPYTVLMTQFFLQWKTCVQFCPKLRRGKATSLVNSGGGLCSLGNKND
jgi:hypothetical protein